MKFAPLLLLVLLTGCGNPVAEPPPVNPNATIKEKVSPSYAELLAIYEAEQKELDRIDAQWKEMIAKAGRDGLEAAKEREKYDAKMIADARAAGDLTPEIKAENDANIAKVEAGIKRAAEANAPAIDAIAAKYEEQEARVNAARAAKDAARPR